MTQPTVEENVVLASVIAIKLGTAWVPQKNVAWHGFGVEERTTGKSLWFYYARNGKWEVSVGLPKDKKGETPYYDEKQFPKPSCNLSITKSPEQLVKDIQRRIFPEYDPLFAEIKRKIELHNQSYDHHDQVKKRVEDTLGVKFRPDFHNPNKTHNELHFDKEQYKYNYEVKVESGKIKLTCSFDNEELALEILKEIQNRI